MLNVKRVYGWVKLLAEVSREPITTAREFIRFLLRITHDYSYSPVGFSRRDVFVLFRGVLQGGIRISVSHVFRLREEKLARKAQSRSFCKG